MWQESLIFITLLVIMFTSGVTSHLGMAMRFSGEMLGEFPQKIYFLVLILLVVYIVATFPINVHITQMTTINGHLSPQLLHKMPFASFAILHTSHVDAFIICFICDCKRVNIKWCICLSFLAGKPSYQTTWCTSNLMWLLWMFLSTGWMH